MDIIGLMGAMEDEIAPLAACMVAKESTSLGGIRFTSGLLGGKKVVLCCAGMGKAQAAAATQLLCTHFGATAIVFSGIAGNMTDKIGVGDVCLGGTLVYHDGEPRMFAETYPHQQEFHSDARLLAAAASACEAAGVKHIVGKIATGLWATRPPKRPLPQNARPIAWRWRGRPWRTLRQRTTCRSSFCAP